VVDHVKFSSHLFLIIIQNLDSVSHTVWAITKILGTLGPCPFGWGLG